MISGCVYEDNYEYVFRGSYIKHARVEIWSRFMQRNFSLQNYAHTVLRNNTHRNLAGLYNNKNHAKYTIH